MGVRNLFPFLKNVAPGCTKLVSMEDLRGKTIAIDGTLLLNREYTAPWLSVAHPKKNILWTIRLMRLCRDYEILPIVIFDTPQTTAAKARERGMRSARRDQDRVALDVVKAKAAKLEELSDTMKAINNLEKAQQNEVMKQFNQSPKAQEKSATPEIMTMERPVDNKLPSPSTLKVEEQATDAQETDIALPPAEATALAQKLMVQLNAIIDSGTQESASELALLLKLLKGGSGIPIEELQRLRAETKNIVDKLSRQFMFPNFKAIKTTVECLRKYRVPVHFSPRDFEAECTASLYARAGYADYVASEDSDVLVYGVPQLRSFMSLRNTSEDQYTMGVLKVVDPVVMRAELSKTKAGPWSMATFTDFAILCGTDFSQSIDQLSINRAHDAMDSGRTLEDAVKAIEELRYGPGRKKGLQIFRKHESFQADATIARTIFSTFPDRETLWKGLGHRRSSDPQRKHFVKLCLNHEKWAAIEAKILEEEGMTAADITFLDEQIVRAPFAASQRAASQQGHSTEHLAAVKLNDDPSRALSNDSGFVIHSAVKRRAVSGRQPRRKLLGRLPDAHHGFHQILEQFSTTRWSPRQHDMT